MTPDLIKSRPIDGSDEINWNPRGDAAERERDRKANAAERSHDPDAEDARDVMGAIRVILFLAFAAAIGVGLLIFGAIKWFRP